MDVLPDCYSAAKIYRDEVNNGLSSALFCRAESSLPQSIVFQVLGYFALSQCCPDALYYHQSLQQLI